MTTETYKSKIKKIDEQVGILLDEKYKIREEFLNENSEFKVGDKVKIYNADWVTKKEEFIKEAFISRVHDKYFFGKINYEFVKVKKDGTASGTSAGVYGFSRLEKINQ